MPVENTPGPATMDKQPECPTAGRERANSINQKADESHTSLTWPSDMLVFIHSTKSWEDLYVLGTVTSVKVTKTAVYRDRQRHNRKLQYAHTRGLEDILNSNWKEFGKKASQRRRWPNCAMKLSALKEQRLGNPRDRRSKVHCLHLHRVRK